MVVPFYDKRNGDGNGANLPNSKDGKEEYSMIVESMA